MSKIKWLMEWYKSNCDGEWEHCYGIQIYTLDNPGWSVKMDMSDTRSVTKEFNAIKKYNDDNDWIHCCVEDTIFSGRGDSEKLDEISAVFQTWVLGEEVTT